MEKKNFTYSFETAKKPAEVFDLLVQIPEWWSGLYQETIEGKSEKVNDTFSFKAGGGMHYTSRRWWSWCPARKSSGW